MTPDGPEKSRRGRKRGEKAGRVRYWQYGQAEKSPDLAISDLSRFLAREKKGPRVKLDSCAMSFGIQVP